MKWEKRQKFSIRKFSVGVASVMVGQFYLGTMTNSPSVKADERTSITAVTNTQSGLDDEAQPKTPVAVTETPATEASEGAQAPAESTETMKQASETPKTEASTRQVTLSYTVDYRDKATGAIVYSETKTVTVDTTDAVASTQVKEHGAALVNASELADYYVAGGESLERTATVTEGSDTHITYDVERFQNSNTEKAKEEREVTLNYDVVYQDAQTGVEVYRETKTTTFKTTDTVGKTVVNDGAAALSTAKELEGYSLFQSAGETTLVEGQANEVRYTVAGQAKNNLQKRGLFGPLPQPLPDAKTPPGVNMDQIVSPDSGVKVFDNGTTRVYEKDGLYTIYRFVSRGMRYTARFNGDIYDYARGEKGVKLKSTKDFNNNPNDPEKLYGIVVDPEGRVKQTQAGYHRRLNQNSNTDGTYGSPSVTYELEGKGAMPLFGGTSEDYHVDYGEITGTRSYSSHETGLAGSTLHDDNAYTYYYKAVVRKNSAPFKIWSGEFWTFDSDKRTDLEFGMGRQNDASKESSLIDIPSMGIDRRPQSEKTPAVGQDVYVPQHGYVGPDAGIANRNALPADTNYAWASPDFSYPHEEMVTTLVTFPDGSQQYVTYKLVVTDQATGIGNDNRGR